MIGFTPETKRAICDVAQWCAQDMEYGDASDAETVAETALDANRLQIYGFPDAMNEVRELIKQHGYSEVLKVVADFVPTA